MFQERSFFNESLLYVRGIFFEKFPLPLNRKWEFKWELKWVLKVGILDKQNSIHEKKGVGAELPLIK